MKRFALAALLAVAGCGGPERPADVALCQSQYALLRQDPRGDSPDRVECCWDETAGRMFPESCNG